ncbi:pentapeptide repeat-containing protein [Maridesulfovibrio sp.]|uniref:pentapeptide repeat-containing protein n=1 Tax=Maridesulfovibrio sp. TaxID=2795000 RepID=UPI0029CA568E|nr:pentapeptide repeat-containing protein [Maridesulfovibrio sp.]
MAGLNYMAILNQGVEAWNKWRGENKGAKPDFFRADLQFMKLEDAIFCDANFFNANLRGANLKGADFEGAYLKEVNLEGANLKGASLQATNLDSVCLVGANLKGANVQGAYLKDANLKDANLQGASFQRAYLGGAYLKGAHLEGANLQGANLRGGTLLNTTFTSKVQLNELEVPLTEKQLSGCIFRDEEEYYEKQSHEKADTETKNEPVYTLRIYTDAYDWTPYDMSVFLMGIQLSVNRVQYLMTTEETDLEKIKLKLRTAFPGYAQTMRVASIHTGSLDFFGNFVEKTLPSKYAKVLIVAAGLVITSSCSLAAWDLHQQSVSQTELNKVLKEKAQLEVVKMKNEMALRGIIDLPEEMQTPQVPKEIIKEHLDIPDEFVPNSKTVEENKEILLTEAAEPMTSAVAQCKKRKAKEIVAETGYLHPDGTFKPGPFEE